MLENRTHFWDSDTTNKVALATGWRKQPVGRVKVKSDEIMTEWEMHEAALFIVQQIYRTSTSLEKPDTVSRAVQETPAELKELQDVRP